MVAIASFVVITISSSAALNSFLLSNNRSVNILRRVHNVNNCKFKSQQRKVKMYISYLFEVRKNERRNNIGEEVYESETLNTTCLINEALEGTCLKINLWGIQIAKTACTPA